MPDTTAGMPAAVTGGGAATPAAVSVGADPRLLDPMISQPGVVGVALALALVVELVLVVVLVDRPLRRAPVNRGNEIVLPRADVRPVGFGGAGDGLAPPRLRLECR
jgi:hypothetical protein